MEAENTPNDKDNEISRDSNEENKKRDSNVASTTAAAREDEQLQQQQGDEVDEQHEHEESESVTKDMVTLFIGQIPKNLDDHFISSLFEKYGDVKQLNIIKDKYNNNRFKGCCFVSYATMDEAMKCIQGLFIYCFLYLYSCGVNSSDSDCYYCYPYLSSSSCKNDGDRV